MSVQLDKVSLSFDNQLLFDKISCCFVGGKVSVIVGRSGSGKTTLLNVISCILPFEGVVTGVNSISYVFQQPRLLGDISVMSNLMAVAKSGDKSTRQAIVSRYLRLADISHLAHRKADTLSGGEQQRVALVRAFVADGELLLMDEPMQSLDIIAKQQLTRVLLDLLANSNKTVIYVTHDLYECMSIADDIYVLGCKPARLTYVAGLQEDKSSRDIFDEQYNNIKRDIVKLMQAD